MTGNRSEMMSGRDGTEIQMMSGRDGTEIRPLLLREAAVGNLAQWTKV